MALFLAAGVAGYMTKGWSQRFPDAVPIIAKYADYDRPLYRTGTCSVREDQPPAAYPLETCYGAPAPDILIWGDSFGAHLYGGLSGRAAPTHLRVGQATSQACPPILSLTVHRNAGCGAFDDHILGLIKRDPPKAVVPSARWELLDLQDIPLLASTITALKGLGIGVIVVGWLPTCYAPALT
jgi:hypothetical protein